MGDQNVSIGPRDGWLTDEQMAEVRGKSLRAQRDERLKGIGPSWTRDGRNVLYSVDGYRSWLASNARQPVREPAPAPEPRFKRRFHRASRRRELVGA